MQANRRFNMKKVLVILICLLMIAGCTKKNNPSTEKKEEIITTEKLYEKLYDLASDYYEKNDLDVFTGNKDEVFISLKEFKEQHKYDISVFEKKSCDLEKSGVTYYINELGSYDASKIIFVNLEGCTTSTETNKTEDDLEDKSFIDVFLGDEKADEGEKQFLSAQMLLYKYADEIYEKGRYKSFEKVDGKYTITLEQLEKMGYDISGFKGFDKKKSKIEIDEDNKYNVKYEGNPIMCSLYNE